MLSTPTMVDTWHGGRRSRPWTSRVVAQRRQHEHPATEPGNPVPPPVGGPPRVEQRGRPPPARPISPDRGRCRRPRCPGWPGPPVGGRGRRRAAELHGPVRDGPDLEKGRGPRRSPGQQGLAVVVECRGAGRVTGDVLRIDQGPPQAPGLLRDRQHRRPHGRAAERRDAWTARWIARVGESAEARMASAASACARAAIRLCSAWSRLRIARTAAPVAATASMAMTTMTATSRFRRRRWNAASSPRNSVGSASVSPAKAAPPRLLGNGAPSR